MERKDMDWGIYLTVGDVLVKWDPLGLDQNSTAAALYEAYDEKIAQVAEKIAPWHRPWSGWLHIQEFIKEAFAPEITKGGMSPAVQGEIAQTAKEIWTALWQSPRHYPELLSCSREEKEMCLQTVANLYRLRSYIYRYGHLDLPMPDAPFLADAGCLWLSIFGIDDVLEIKKFFYQSIAAKGAVGAGFLNDALAAEGMLLYQRFMGRIGMLDAAQWGWELCRALEGMFCWENGGGADFTEQVRAVMEREIQAQEEDFLTETPKTWDPSRPIRQWPRAEGKHIGPMLLRQVLENVFLENGIQAVGKISAAVARISSGMIIKRSCGEIGEILEYVFGENEEDRHLFQDMACSVKAAYLEIPPYVSCLLRCSVQEKERALETAAGLFKFSLDVSADGWRTAAKRWSRKERPVTHVAYADTFFSLCLRDTLSQAGEIQEADMPVLRKKWLRRLAAMDLSGWGFLCHLLALEGMAAYGRVEQVCDTVKALLGPDYTEKIEQILEKVRLVHKRKKRREGHSPSIFPEFDKLMRLTRKQCGQLLQEVARENPNELAYALKGAGDQIADRLLRSLPKEERLEEERTLLIPIHVRKIDVECAQKDILERARKLFADEMQEKTADRSQ